MAGINDKRKIFERIGSLQKVVLEIGCGSNKKIPHAIGVDALDYDGVDIVGDVFEVLAAFPTSSVDQIYSFHFVEHVGDFQGLLEEMARVLKKGGGLEITVPHFSNPYFYSDPTHKTFFGLYTLCYYANESIFSRKVPTYQQSLRFDLNEVDLVFKSGPPFFIRHGIKKVFGFIFNSSVYMKELYEENVSHVFPCYEIRYRLERV